MRRWVCLAALLCNSIGYGEDWPAWRGPRGDGTATGTGYPSQWDTKTNILWKTPLPAKGHSSPIVVGDTLYVTGCLEGERPAPAKKGEKPAKDITPRERMLYALDISTGKIRWQRTVLKAPLEGIHKLNSFASSTPASDGQFVFVTFLEDPNIRLFCFRTNGDEVWNKTLGTFSSKHGFCSPPILDGDRVIVNGDHDGAGYLIALDKATGQTRWKIARPNNTRSYCPPLIVQAAGKRQLVMSGSKCVCSYNPEDGTEIWRVDGPTEQFVASMVYHRELFFLTAGFPTYHVMAIKPDGTGNVTKSHVVWHETKGAGYVPSPIAIDGLFFNVKDDGLASCRDAKSGALHWAERLGKHHSASPVVAEGRLYFVDDFGIFWVVKAEKSFEILAKNDVKEGCSASPAFSNGRIYLRTEQSVIAIGR
jgi:outer membrane protein assembly factor BamB